MPSKKTEKTWVYLTPEQAEQIKRIADHFGVSRSNFIRIATMEKAERIEKILAERAA